MHQYLLIYHVNIVSSIIQCIGIRTEDKQNDDKAKLMSNNFENTILNRWTFFFRIRDKLKCRSRAKLISSISRSDQKAISFFFYSNTFMLEINVINGLSKLSTKSSLISILSFL